MSAQDVAARKMMGFIRINKGFGFDRMPFPGKTVGKCRVLYGFVGVKMDVLVSGGVSVLAMRAGLWGPTCLPHPGVRNRVRVR